MGNSSDTINAYFEGIESSEEIFEGAIEEAIEPFAREGFVCEISTGIAAVIIYIDTWSSWNSIIDRN